MINGCKIGHLIPVVTTYSFDRETPVKLFESDKEAEEYLRKMYEEELRIDREENGYDTEGMIETVTTSRNSGSGLCMVMMP